VPSGAAALTSVAAVYNPPYNRVDEADAVAMIEEAALGHLVSAGAGGAPGLAATALPFMVDRGGAGPLRLRLRAHFARANDHWKSLDGADVLVIFPLADGYVSPGWYPSKAEHGRVVPTWNYEVVQVHGRATVHDDPEWVRAMVTDLTDHHEAAVAAADESASVWKVTDAPPEFVDGQLRAIVGIEIAVTRIEGKRKLSQNRSVEDHAGVVAGHERSGPPRSAGLTEAMQRRHG